VRGLKTISLVGGLGVKDQQNGLLRSLNLVPCDFFLAGWSKRSILKKTKESLMNWSKKIADTFAALPHDFLRKNIDSVSSRLQKGVSKKWGYVKI